MLDLAQKRKVRSVIYNRATIAVLLVVTALFLHSTYSVYKKKEESEKLKNISLQYKNSLEKRYNEMNSQIENLQTETGIEAEIRSKFNVAKDNESIVVIVDDDNSTSSKATTTPTGFWQKIRNFFGF